MQSLPTLILDLAVILTYAGIFTLLFKRLKQPLVLGYIVAGFLATKYIPFTPSVTDAANVKTWADIGVIFLLFALGLEFSFKKIMKVGGTAIVATCTIVFFMMLCGIAVGYACGWKQMDCIFLGGMIAMSSTTIIYKAFDDMGIRQQKFAGLVLSILILEDILAIVLMVMLSTVAVRHQFEGEEMIASLAKLFFFLVLWFVVGIFLIPSFFRRNRAFLSEEMLLLVSLSFCFIMVYIASKVGFSPAFGAFIMGSILAETIEGEKIERLVKPVKDLFGAIFFVSVGMMVDPVMIAEYALPITLIILTVIVGQAFFGTLGVLLSGQPLKIAMQSGFSLTQIGEFSFIIATLGVTLGVTSSFLYPVVVAVSVITTFLTPYLIKLALPAYFYLERRLPASWIILLDRFTSGSNTVNHESKWKELLMGMLRIVLIYSIVTIAVIVLCLQFVVPVLGTLLDPFWGNLLGALVTILLCAPFLRAIVIKKNRSEAFKLLWNDKKVNHAPLVTLLVAKALVALMFVVFIINRLCSASILIAVLVAVVLVAGMVYCRYLKKKSIVIERKFLRNFRMKENYLHSHGRHRKPSYAGGLLARDLHLTEITLPANSSWAGKTLLELNLGKVYGVHVASILRGDSRLNIPGGQERLFPQDQIQVIGTDESLGRFCEKMALSIEADKAAGYSSEDTMLLKSFVLDPGSPLIGKTIQTSNIRERFKCLVVGLEREEESYASVPAFEIFREKDVVWVVGEEQDVYRLAHFQQKGSP